MWFLKNFYGFWQITALNFWPILHFNSYASPSFHPNADHDASSLSDTVTFLWSGQRSGFLNDVWKGFPFLDKFSSIFHSVKFWVMSWTDCWKTYPGHVPNMDDFSRNRSSPWPKKLKLRKNGWFFQKSVWFTIRKAKIFEKFLDEISKISGLNLEGLSRIWRNEKSRKNLILYHIKRKCSSLSHLERSNAFFY